MTGRFKNSIQLEDNKDYIEEALSYTDGQSNYKIRLVHTINEIISIKHSGIDIVKNRAWCDCNNCK